MLAFQVINGQVVKVAKSYSERSGDGWIDRHSFDTYESAVVMAQLAGEQYLAIDKGDSVHPRYDVIERPQIGDKISYCFNGDSYADGEIVSISSTLKKIVSSTGKSYYRKGLSGTWKYNKTWSMVNGHSNEKNPSF